MDEVWFWLLVLGLGTAGGLWVAFRALHTARLLEDTPTSRVRSAAQGYVELAGRGEPLAGTGNLAPLTLRPCVWWSYRIEQRVTGRSGRKHSWRVVQQAESAQPFALVDETGQCIVDPRGAQVLAGEATSWWGHTPWPTEPPGASLRRIGGERDYRYTERRIYAHERLHALGEFRSVDGIGERSLEDEAGAVLLEWKQDRPAMVERFDTDRDGDVSMAEWLAAHELARDAVAERRSTRVAAPALHTLACPADGRPFVLAAFSERDLVRRYRRRALIGFVAVFAAAYALGWLLSQLPAAVRSAP